MLAEKIGSVSKVLSTLSHQVSPEVWEVLKLAKKELLDAYDLAREIETKFYVPKEIENEQERISKK